MNASALCDLFPYNDFLHASNYISSTGTTGSSFDSINPSSHNIRSTYVPIYSNTTPFTNHVVSGTNDLVIDKEKEGTLADRVLVVGYYNKDNLGDDAYQPIMKHFFPDEHLEFINSRKLSTIKSENYDAIIVGGGDIINDYFNADIAPFLRGFKGPKIAFSIGIPFPSLITDKYLGHFDHVFTRNYEDLRSIQRVLGTNRVHFIPDITLAYKPNRPHKSMITDCECASSVLVSAVNDTKVISSSFGLRSPLTGVKPDLPEGGIGQSCAPFGGKHCGIFLIGNLIRFPTIVEDISHLVGKLALTYDIIMYCFDPNEDMKICQIVRTQALERLDNSHIGDKRYLTKRETSVDNSSTTSDRITINTKKYTAQEMIDIMTNLDFALCMRYHAHIFCTVAGTPFMSISSTRKTRSYMKQSGLSRYQYEIELDGYGTPIGSNYEEMREVCRHSIHNRTKISEQLSDFLAQSRFLLSSNQAARLLKTSKTDIRVTVANFIRETNDYQNAARILNNYIIGYPDNSYIWGMYDKFKKAAELDQKSAQSQQITNIKLELHDRYLEAAINESARFLMRNGAILKNNFQQPASLQPDLSQRGQGALNSYTDIDSTGQVSGITTICNDPLPIFVNLREYQSYNGAHRGGWYLACEELFRLSSRNRHNNHNGMICDMYVDRTFHWARSYMLYRGIIPYTSPWCGFIHHTSDVSYSEYNAEVLFTIPEFIQSLHTCLALFTLSEPLSHYIANKLVVLAPHVKIITFAHPVTEPNLTFDINAYKANQNPKLINIGAWMRNPFTIYRATNVPIQRAVLVGKEMRDYLPPPNFSISSLPVISERVHQQIITPRTPSLITSENIQQQIITPRTPSGGPGLRSRSSIGSIDENLVPSVEFGLSIGQRSNDEVINELHHSVELVSEYNIGEKQLVKSNRVSSSKRRSVKQNRLPRWIAMLNSWLRSQGLRDSYYENGTLYIREVSENKIASINDKVKEMICQVEQIKYQPNEDYDRLLSENIVFLDLVDAAAVNTIIECIVRRTPILVNKVPGTIALLGEHYPLFYNDVEQIGQLVSVEHIEAAHIYLKKLDRKRYRLNYFVNHLRDVLKELEMSNG